MSLIKCSECQKEVSDKASSCPSCGNPINATKSPVAQVITNPSNPVKIDLEFTSKKWKKAKLISWGVIILGIIITGSEQPVSSNNITLWIGISLIGYGIIALIIGKIGAWYADKRAR